MVSYNKKIESLNNRLDAIIELSEYYDSKKFKEFKKLLSEKYIKQLTDSGIYENENGEHVVLMDWDDYGDKIIIGFIDLDEFICENIFPALERIILPNEFPDLNKSDAYLGEGFYNLFYKATDIAYKYRTPIGTWIQDEIIITDKLEKLTEYYDDITSLFDTISPDYSSANKIDINFSKLSIKKKKELMDKVNKAKTALNIIIKTETGNEPISKQNKNSLYFLFKKLIKELK
jgi:hypothetical protein